MNAPRSEVTEPQVQAVQHTFVGIDEAALAQVAGGRAGVPRLAPLGKVPVPGSARLDKAPAPSLSLHQREMKSLKKMGLPEPIPTPKNRYEHLE